jgi:hypothetical protein
MPGKPDGTTPRTTRRRRTSQIIAASAVAGLVVAGTTVIGAQGASAAALPNSQSVGRFVDGSLGKNPIQNIADVKDARALNPGTVTDQNPLDVNVLQAIDLPLTGALQLPQLLGIKLGAVNQVAVAKSDGYSYGASGAVLNSGGVSVGGNNNAFPANATIDLSASGIAGNSGVPVPGGTTADALGGVKLSIGAVSALASTPAGTAKPGSTAYGIAGIDLVAESPLLGSLLTGVVGPIGTLLGELTKLPSACVLNAGKLPDLTLENGAITIGSSSGKITVSLDKLLDVLLGSSNNINHLPPNTDLIDLLLNYLTSPSGLAAGLANAINGLVGGLKTSLDACTPTQLKPLVNLLFNSGQALEKSITALLTKLGGSVGGKSPLAPLGTVLKKLVDIGINVQPNGKAGTFTSSLKATPNQATPVVPGQTIVRAIEINLLGNSLATLALANAAAGPSNPQVATPTTPPVTTGPPNTHIPTGIPAGAGSTGGSASTSLVLLAAGIVLAGGGAAFYRLRGRYSR